MLWRAGEIGPGISSIQVCCQLSAQLWLISSGLGRILVFYSGLLWGDDVTSEAGGGAAYVCAGRRDYKSGLLEVGISFCSLVAVC